MSEYYPKKLIIIGNGFDLWLGLPTKYENYKEYISDNEQKFKNCYKLFKLVEQIFKKNKWTVNLWSNLEQNLFNLLNNGKNIIDELVNEIKNENIDLIQAIIEKNESIKNWICQIRSKHEGKLNELNKWYKKIIQQNHSFLWNFNYVQNWKGMEFFLPYDRQILCVAEAHGHYETNPKLEYGPDEIGFQLGASWQQIISEKWNNKYKDYVIESQNSLKKELNEALIKDLEIKDVIKKWVKFHPLFFLLLFCCKHKNIVEQLQKTFKTSVSKNCIYKMFLPYLVEIGLNDIAKALFPNSDTQKRSGENFNINHAYLPIKFWKQNNTFPDVYILGLNIDGKDKLYFVDDEASPLKLSIKNKKECYLSYYGDDDKKVKKEQYKKVLQIKNDNVVNNHVLEFKDLAKKAFGLDLFNELMIIKKIN